MMPIKTFVSERQAANLCQQIRWRDGVYCSHCRTESLGNADTFALFQREEVVMTGRQKEVKRHLSAEELDDGRLYLESEAATSERLHHELAHWNNRIVNKPEVRGIGTNDTVGLYTPMVSEEISTPYGCFGTGAVVVSILSASTSTATWLADSERSGLFIADGFYLWGKVRSETVGPILLSVKHRLGDGTFDADRSPRVGAVQLRFEKLGGYNSRYPYQN